MSQSRTIAHYAVPKNKLGNRPEATDLTHIWPCVPGRLSLLWSSSSNCVAQSSLEGQPTFSITWVPPYAIFQGGVSWTGRLEEAITQFKFWQHNWQHVWGVWTFANPQRRLNIGGHKTSSGLKLNHNLSWSLRHYTEESGLSANSASTPWTWWWETVICALAKDAQFGSQMTWHERQKVVISGSKSSPGLLTHHDALRFGQGCQTRENNTLWTISPTDRDFNVTKPWERYNTVTVNSKVQESWVLTHVSATTVALNHNNIINAHSDNSRNKNWAMQLIFWKTNVKHNKQINANYSKDYQMPRYLSWRPCVHVYLPITFPPKWWTRIKGTAWWLFLELKPIWAGSLPALFCLASITNLQLVSDDSNWSLLLLESRGFKIFTQTFIRECFRVPYQAQLVSPRMKKLSTD